VTMVKTRMPYSVSIYLWLIVSYEIGVVNGKIKKNIAPAHP
jgi:hypothetical protein